MSTIIPSIFALVLGIILGMLSIIAFIFTAYVVLLSLVYLIYLLLSIIEFIPIIGNQMFFKRKKQQMDYLMDYLLVSL